MDEVVIVKIKDTIEVLLKIDSLNETEMLLVAVFFQIQDKTEAGVLFLVVSTEYCS